MGTVMLLDHKASWKGLPNGQFARAPATYRHPNTGTSLWVWRRTTTSYVPPGDLHIPRQTALTAFQPLLPNGDPSARNLMIGPLDGDFSAPSDLAARRQVNIVLKAGQSLCCSVGAGALVAIRGAGELMEHVASRDAWLVLHTPLTMGARAARTGSSSDVTLSI